MPSSCATAEAKAVHGAKAIAGKERRGELN